MPATEPRRGDTVRDPRVLLAVAALLLLLRAGVTAWEDHQRPVLPRSAGQIMPDSLARPHMMFSGSWTRHGH